MRADRSYCRSCCGYQVTRRVASEVSVRIECSVCDWLVSEFVFKRPQVALSDRPASPAFAAQWFRLMHLEVEHAG